MKKQESLIRSTDGGMGCVFNWEVIIQHLSREVEEVRAESCQVSILQPGAPLPVVGSWRGGADETLSDDPADVGKGEGPEPPP